MTADFLFRVFEENDRQDCLRIFDENCPEFFAPNERPDFSEYLRDPGAYAVCLMGGRVVGAYGLRPEGEREMSLRWILLSPRVQHRGLGTAIMTRVLADARSARAMKIKIAASHRSAPFFTRFGALTVTTIVDGWGPGMHRVEMELVP
jgi:RimJ/RimL family protein N-acetyltransferase